MPRKETKQRMISKSLAEVLLRLEWQRSFFSLSLQVLSRPSLISPGKSFDWTMNGKVNMGFPSWDVTQLHGGGRKQSACLLTYLSSTLKKAPCSFSSLSFFLSFYTQSLTWQSRLAVKNSTTPRWRTAEVGTHRGEKRREKRCFAGAILVRPGLFWTSHAEAANLPAVWRPSPCNKAVLATGESTSMLAVAHGQLRQIITIRYFSHLRRALACAKSRHC